MSDQSLIENLIHQYLGGDVSPPPGEITQLAPSSEPGMPVTIFPDQRASRMERHHLELPDLARLIRDTHASTKGQLPWLKGAVFSGERTKRGCLRSNKAIIAITAIEGDYDRGEISPQEARERLEDADIQALVYTTPSHLQPGKGNRWRVFAPTSKELPPEQRSALVARLNGIFDGELDDASFTLSQAFYFGNVDGGSPVTTLLVDGERCIDEAGDLDERAVDRKGSSPSQATSGTSAPVGDGTGLSFDEFADALMAIPNDGSDPNHSERLWWFRIVAGIHHESSGSTDGLELAVRWSKQWPGKEEAETRTPAERRQYLVETWQSLDLDSPVQITGETVLSMARMHGWQDPRRADVDPDEFEDLPIEDRQPPVGESARLQFLTPEDCEHAPVRGYVLKGMIAPGDVGCLFGAPGVGKSLIAPHIGYTVAQGRSAFQMRSRSGEIFYVAAEDETGMKGRVRALKERWGDAPHFTLVAGVSDLLSPRSSDLRELMAAVKDRSPSLVFIDTLAMAFPGLEENDAASMGRVVSVARKIASHGAAVILVHHDTKEGTGTPRGHSLFNGALDFALQLSRDDTGIVRGRLTKNRNGTCDRDIAFHIDARSFGEDEDGDAITAALVEELGDSHRPEQTLTKAERAALEILAEELGGTAGQQEWRDACMAGRTVSEADKEDSRRRAANRAIKFLVQKEVVSFDKQREIYSTLAWDDDDD